nr:PREDICTED: tyrosine-protein phosphatase Lar-like [Linepithema humile]
MTWKDEYEEATIFYSFIIQGQFNNYYVQKSWNRIFPNTTHLIGNFADLEIGTTYLIKYGLQIEKSTVYSDWHSVETDCIPILLFDITLGETNLTINWQINENVSLRQQSCPPNWYRLEVQHNNTVVHVVNESAMHFPYEVSSLKPYTLYNVIIFRKYLKLFSQEIRTHEGVPTPVLNFRAMSQSSEQVTTINHSDNITLMWQEPSLPNGEIVRYDVTVKVKTYIGCMDMELPSPNNHIIEISTKNTTITISNFHPYAYYSVSVTAFNSNYGSTAIETIFQTNESDIPTEIFSQLILQGQILSWTIPEDCTTITGPLKAKIKIYGISDLVKNFSFTDWTKSYFYDLKHIIPQLHGAERYVAKVYVIRDWKSSENASAFQKYEFETPPAAPPQITNLDVVEIDTRHTPATIYLRWQSPLPPFNGKLDYYVIRICDMYYRTPCQNFSVQVNKSCDLWNDYICGSVKNWSTNFQIQILTYNINVTQPSVPVNVTKAMLNNTIPDTPENYTFTINNNSIVDVRWNHPWKTGSHLQNFNIWLEEISSNLTMRVFQPSVFKMQKYTVTHYMRYYNKQLYLFPSTLYHIHIQAVTVTDKVSAVNTVIVQTRTAIDFDGNVNITMQEPNSTISISIPPVVNETRNSVMHILVKGCNFCEQYSEVPEILQAEINMDKNAWMQAAEGSISKFANSTFILGNKETCGRVTNCSLKSEGLYEIAIIITEENLIIKRIMFTTSIHNFSIEVPSQYHKAYVICPIITCLVLIAVTFYFYRRRKKQTAKQCTSQDGIVLSPNIRNCVSEDCVDETTSVISTSKQIRNKSEEESNTIPIEIYENTRILSANLSTASDRQPLSLE